MSTNIVKFPSAGLTAATLGRLQTAAAIKRIDLEQLARQWIKKPLDCVTEREGQELLRVVSAAPRAGLETK